jgi:hypothetical protein
VSPPCAALSIGEVLEVPVFLLDQCLLVCVRSVLLEVRPVTQNKFTRHTLPGLNIGPPEPDESSGSVAATWSK